MGVTQCPQLGGWESPADGLQARGLNAGDVRKLDIAIARLQVLADDPDQFGELLALQRFLLQRICSRERMIQRVRKLEGHLRRSLRSGQLDRAEAKRVKATLRECGPRVDLARHWIFLWKCFGDGAACVYQSPYNLKHFFFDQDYNVKEDPGFISGKEGLSREWSILEYGIASGVPVVLADLTNMIRMGDICALAGADPLPIEVKSSTLTSARVARQQRNLDEVMTFFENDGAAIYRGRHNVIRQELSTGPCYQDQMNDCITRALSVGSAVVSPEPGLHYFAATSVEHIGPEITALLQPTTLLRSLTPDPGWLPCLPFTTTLRRDNLIAFIERSVSVFVLIDMARLKSLFLEQGCHATMVMDGECAVQISIDPDDLMQGCMRVSELTFARIALEFQSLGWFAKQHALQAEEPGAPITMEALNALPKDSYCVEAPREWATAKDLYAATPLGEE